MKKKFQFFLFLLIFIISLIFYNTYFKSSVQKEVSNSVESEEKDTINKNNVIKNLKYDVKFDDNSKYNISSKISEIINEDENEVVLMNDVIAKFNDGKNPTIYITSDRATFKSFIDASMASLL